MRNGKNYIGSYHIHVDNGGNEIAMVGAKHTSEPHDTLEPQKAGLLEKRVEGLIDMANIKRAFEQAYDPMAEITRGEPTPSEIGMMAAAVDGMVALFTSEVMVRVAFLFTKFDDKELKFTNASINPLTNLIKSRLQHELKKARVVKLGRKRKPIPPIYDDFENQLYNYVQTRILDGNMDDPITGMPVTNIVSKQKSYELLIKEKIVQFIKTLRGTLQGSSIESAGLLMNDYVTVKESFIHSSIIDVPSF